jgi:hypothetical protein
VKLLTEETIELRDAPAARDPAAVLDALADLQYVLDGAYLQLGFAAAKNAALGEVHRSNMSKLGADGKPVVRADGKILKGPNYSPPDLREIVELLTADADEEPDDGADHSSENDPDFCYECQNHLDDCECEDNSDYEDALRHGDLDDRRAGCVLGEQCLAADPFHTSAECFDVEMAEAFMGPEGDEQP